MTARAARLAVAAGRGAVSLLLFSSSSTTTIASPLIPHRLHFSSAPALHRSPSPTLTDELRRPARSPWLLLPRTEADEASDVCRLYSPRDGAALASRLPRGLRWLCCLGSTDGWLVVVDPSFNLHLLNPLTSARLRLPSINALSLPCLASASSPCVPTLPAVVGAFPDRVPGIRDVVTGRIERRAAANSIISKEHMPCDEGDAVVTDQGLYFGKTVVAMEFSPSHILRSDPSDYTAVAICGRHKELAIARAGDGFWTMLSTQHCLFQDVIHYRGWFYAVNEMGSVEGIDPASNSPQWEDLFRGPIGMRRGTGRRYLVESSGKLLLVNRLVKRDVFEEDGVSVAGYRTMEFEVFKLGETMDYWVRVQSLGDQALLLGGNHSVSLSTHDIPELKRNCIYFTDDDWESNMFFGHTACSDLGMYSLDDRSIGPLSLHDPKLLSAALIWVVPPMKEHEIVRDVLPFKAVC